MVTKLKLTVNETKTRVAKLPAEKFDSLRYSVLQKHMESEFNVRAQWVKRILNRGFIGTTMLMGSMPPCCLAGWSKPARPWHETRAVVNGVLWILDAARSGPRCRISILRTCPRRFELWGGQGKFGEALHLLANHLRERGKLHLGL